MYSSSEIPPIRIRVFFSVSYCSLTSIFLQSLPSNRIFPFQSIYLLNIFFWKVFLSKQVSRSKYLPYKHIFQNIVFILQTNILSLPNIFLSSIFRPWRVFCFHNVSSKEMFPEAYCPPPKYFPTNLIFSPQVYISFISILCPDKNIFL